MNDPEVWWGMIDKGGTVAVLVVLVFAFVRGWIYPKAVVDQLRKELNETREELAEQRREDREDARLAQQGVALADRAVMTRLQLMADVVGRRDPVGSREGSIRDPRETRERSGARATAAELAEQSDALVDEAPRTPGDAAD